MRKKGPDVPSLFCHLTNIRTGALISASPTAGDRPLELGYHREAFMKHLFQATVALLSVAAWPAAAQPSPPAPTTLETLGAMHPAPLIGRKSRKPVRRRIRSSR